MSRDLFVSPPKILFSQTNYFLYFTLLFTIHCRKYNKLITNYKRTKQSPVNFGKILMTFYEMVYHDTFGRKHSMGIIIARPRNHPNIQMNPKKQMHREKLRHRRHPKKRQRNHLQYLRHQDQHRHHPRHHPHPIVYN